MATTALYTDHKLISSLFMHPNSAIEFLILPVDAPKHDGESESRQEAADFDGDYEHDIAIFSVIGTFY